MKELLKLDKDDPLIAPLSTDNLDQTVQDRCLKYMAQYTCELSFDVPNPSPQTTQLAKMSAVSTFLVLFLPAFAVLPIEECQVAGRESLGSFITTSRNIGR